MDNLEFINSIRERFEQTMESFDFSFMDVSENGYYGNCEVVYRNGYKCVMLMRERGSLRVFCGYENQGELKLWLLDSLVNYFKQPQGKPKNDDFDLRSSIEIGDFAQEYQLAQTLLQDNIPDVFTMIEGVLFSDFVVSMDEFVKKQSDLYIDKLAEKVRKEQKKI